MAKKAMSSKTASEKKLTGHANEQDFADVICGRVQQGSHIDKKDVIDRQDNSHSVKAGKWWQVFLYSVHRLQTNTIFQGLGQVASIMIDCINVYPENIEDYVIDKNKVKQALRPYMRLLRGELSDPVRFKAFLDKGLFDGGNAQYLSVYWGPAKDPRAKKVFHVFAKDDVTAALVEDLEVANSQARTAKQTSEQKVVFRSKLLNKQIGEIEDRHDSKRHYREMKCRLNSFAVRKILENKFGGNSKQLSKHVVVYGRASKKFKLN